MSTAQTKIKPRYRSPVRYAEAEISLDEFSSDELVAELKHRGETLSEIEGEAPDGLYLSPLFLSRLGTLLLCGQGETATDDLLATVDPLVDYRFRKLRKAGQS